ncbi:Membrane protease YdiL, CAAX protease family [Pseudobutyrivibrio sp. NOR37]|uniref:CPBP family intramembrane metalloprotease n=1 Tax=Pseudobutyrivibrio xylanivorans TaxID=185007 RepID=A0A6M0LF55_PSEXY|nr:MULTISPECIES: type II CAAX endopeptidase family protein [Pseudobutyrivibrio]NEX00517.1 CPBP family intramembrane metalloprotease [Pseudobutyrivibrio xylanivorans]SFR60494.1 Membrane protease YdiL, CAAX protease family [Pseudobutyrivibrio sp. NOR37]
MERTAKQTFSAVGLAFFIYIAVSFVLQMIFSTVVYSLVDVNNPPSWAMWVSSFVPMYCIAFPIFILLIKRVPAEPFVETKTLNFPNWLRFFTLTTFGMVAGALIASFVGKIFENFSINTNVTMETLTSTNSALAPIVLAILAPIVEEFIFRKFLIDRIHVYGGKVAVVTSAAMFALFHGNFSQVFYTFLMGLVWGYVYYKTGKVIYTIIMHMLVNFGGSVVSVYFLNKLNGVDTSDIEALLASPDAMAGVAGIIIYVFILYGLAIAGLICLIIGFKKRSYSQERLELPEEGKVATVCLNVGMILFLLICAFEFVLSIANGFVG